MFGRLLYVIAVIAVGGYGLTNTYNTFLIIFWLIASILTLVGVVAVVEFIVRGPLTPEQKAKDDAQIEAIKECFRVK